MSTTIYDIGDVVRVSANFKSTAGVNADPTDVLVRVERPDATSTGSTNPTKPSVGNYYYDFAVTQAGRHTYRWVGTGAIVSASEGAFTVQPRQTT